MLNFFDEFNAAKVHIVLLCPESALFVNALWEVAVRVYKLTCTEEECQVLVVIKAPDTMGASWLKPVSCLDFPHE